MQITPQTIARMARMIETLKSCEIVFKGWLHDADPHKDLKWGESAERDAAEMMLQKVRSALIE